MKFLPIIATLAATASALPRDEFAGHEEEIKSWEIYDTHPDFIKAKSVTIFSNELLDGDSSQCPTAIWILARGSTEQGNMVRSPSDLHNLHVSIIQSLLSPPLFIYTHFLNHHMTAN